MNYQWRFFEGDTNNISSLENTKSRNKSKGIIMYENGVEIERFNSIDECAVKYPHIKKPQVRMVLNGTRKTHRGYTFKWMEVNDMVYSDEKSSEMA